MEREKKEKVAEEAAKQEAERKAQADADEKKLEEERVTAATKSEDEARALLQENADIVKQLTE